MDITRTKCVPESEAPAKCSGELTGDKDVDANGNEYISYRKIVNGTCQCISGTGPSAEYADDKYCFECDAYSGSHIARMPIEGPYDLHTSCPCDDGYVRRNFYNYGYFECIPECPDEPYALLSRDGRTCSIQDITENCGINEEMYDIPGKRYLKRCDCTEGYTVGPTGNCMICTDGYQMVSGHCISILPTLMEVEDKCAYPLKKSFISGAWTCDPCPLKAPYAKYDSSQSDLTTCVSYMQCAYPEVRYFAELDKSFAVCSDRSSRFDFKSNGVNVTIISRAVSVLAGERYVAEVSDKNVLSVRLENTTTAIFMESGVSYVRSYGGDGFIFKKEDGKYYAY